MGQHSLIFSLGIVPILYFLFGVFFTLRLAFGFSRPEGYQILAIGGISPFFASSYSYFYLDQLKKIGLFNSVVLLECLCLLFISATAYALCIFSGKNFWKEQYSKARPDFDKSEEKIILKMLFVVLWIIVLNMTAYLVSSGYDFGDCVNNSRCRRARFLFPKDMYPAIIWFNCLYFQFIILVLFLRMTYFILLKTNYFEGLSRGGKKTRVKRKRG